MMKLMLIIDGSAYKHVRSSLINGVDSITFGIGIRVGDDIWMEASVENEEQKDWFRKQHVKIKGLKTIYIQEDET